MSVGLRLGDIPDGGYSIHVIQPWPGYWLARYDPDARDGIGEAEFTHDSTAAMEFADFAEAEACWGQTSTVTPVLEDGSPNRPLSVLSVTVDTIPPESFSK